MPTNWGQRDKHLPYLYYSMQTSKGALSDFAMGVLQSVGLPSFCVGIFTVRTAHFAPYWVQCRRIQSKGRGWDPRGCSRGITKREVIQSWWGIILRFGGTLSSSSSPSSPFPPPAPSILAATRCRCRPSTGIRP